MGVSVDSSIGVTTVLFRCVVATSVGLCGSEYKNTIWAVVWLGNSTRGSAELSPKQSTCTRVAFLTLKQKGFIFSYTVLLVCQST